VRLLVLGAGYAGGATARSARARGLSVIAGTRRAERAAELAALGLDARIGAPAQVLEAVREASPRDDDLRVLIAFPPDGATDAALAPRLATARSVVYVSSTGVYGTAVARIDDATEVARAGLARRNALRVEAEELYRSIGASVVRVPAIYGPGRGLQMRLASGTLRLPEGADHVSSRIHVDDLAEALVSLLGLGLARETFVAGDRLPASHREVVAFLCEAMRLPMPRGVPIDQVDESLRVERVVDASRLWSTLGLEPRYPTYREGFAQALRVGA
jgi:nucleoside-diphosphate-sugar epimerase